MEGLRDAVAIVTGGARGIGAGVVRSFVKAGVNVVIADILETEAAAVAASQGERCLFVRTDLRSDVDIGALVGRTVGHFGRIDFLINVACSYADRGFDSDRANWHDVFDVNMIGHVMLVRAAHPHLVASGRGSVVHFASASGHFAQAGRWIYPATKAAIEQLTRSQALDLAPDGIRVNAVLPGWVRKDGYEQFPPDVKARYEGHAQRLHMMGRLGEPDEIGEAVLYLCSAHAGFTTGAVLRVDGGYTALGPQGRDKVLPTALRAAASQPGSST